MTTLEKILLHRERVAKAKNFKEFKEINLDWLDMLIDLERADEAKREAVERWVATFRPEVNVEMKKVEE